MNDHYFDSYVKLIAERTGMFSSDVRKVLEAVQQVGGLPNGQVAPFHHGGHNSDVLGSYGPMIMGKPG